MRRRSRDGQDCLLKKGVNPLIKALETILEPVIKWSIVGELKKWIALHCHEASHGKAHQESKGVVDEPSSETSEKESQIDLKKKITLLFQTFKPAPLFWLIWMFFAFVLADLGLPLFFMEMVISQNVDSAVNYLSILPFPCLIVI